MKLIQAQRSDGRDVIINVERITNASFNHDSGQLYIEFDKGNGVTLRGEEAARVWVLLQTYLST